MKALTFSSGRGGAAGAEGAAGLAGAAVAAGVTAGIVAVGAIGSGRSEGGGAGAAGAGFAGEMVAGAAGWAGEAGAAFFTGAEVAAGVGGSKAGGTAAGGTSAGAGRVAGRTGTMAGAGAAGAVVAAGRAAGATAAALRGGASGVVQKSVNATERTTSTRAPLPSTSNQCWAGVRAFDRPEGPAPRASVGASGSRSRWAFLRASLMRLISAERGDFNRRAWPYPDAPGGRPSSSPRLTRARRRRGGPCRKGCSPRGECRGCRDAPPRGPTW
jgi:hypothetical protein